MAVAWLRPGHFSRIILMWFFYTVFYDAPTNNWKACPFFFFAVVGEISNDGCNNPKKYKIDHILSENGKRGGKLTVSLHLRFKYEVEISNRNSQNRNWAGHRSNATCSHRYFCLMCCNRFVVTSLEGWRVTNRAVELISIVCLCLRDCLRQFSPWSGTPIFGAVMQI